MKKKIWMLTALLFAFASAQAPEGKPVAVFDPVTGIMFPWPALLVDQEHCEFENPDGDELHWCYYLPETSASQAVWGLTQAIGGGSRYELRMEFLEDRLAPLQFWSRTPQGRYLLISYEPAGDGTLLSATFD